MVARCGRGAIISDRTGAHPPCPVDGVVPEAGIVVKRDGPKRRRWGESGGWLVGEFRACCKMPPRRVSESAGLWIRSENAKECGEFFRAWAGCSAQPGPNRGSCPNLSDPMGAVQSDRSKARPPSSGRPGTGRAAPTSKWGLGILRCRHRLSPIPGPHSFWVKAGAGLADRGGYDALWTGCGFGCPG